MWTAGLSSRNWSRTAYGSGVFSGENRSSSDSAWSSLGIEVVTGPVLPRVLGCLVRLCGRPSLPATRNSAMLECQVTRPEYQDNLSMIETRSSPPRDPASRTRSAPSTPTALARDRTFAFLTVGAGARLTHPPESLHDDRRSSAWGLSPNI